MFRILFTHMNYQTKQKTEGLVSLQSSMILCFVVNLNAKKKMQKYTTIFLKFWYFFKLHLFLRAL